MSAVAVAPAVAPAAARPRDDAAAVPRPVADAARRIAAAHPEVDVAVVGAALEDALRRTEGARVQSYRLVLAEREVRRALTRRRAR